MVRHGYWLGETNGFHNGFLFGVDCSKSARNEESSSRGALNSGLTSADSGLQLDLEIALGGASAKVKPPNRLFRTGRKCVETSDDVIESDFTITPDSRILDFSPTPQPSCKTPSNLSSTKSKAMFECTATIETGSCCETVSIAESAQCPLVRRRAQLVTCLPG